MAGYDFERRRELFSAFFSRCCVYLLREVAALPTDGARTQVHRRSVRALFILICSSFSDVFVVCKLAVHVTELSYIAYSYNEGFINSLK